MALPEREYFYLDKVIALNEKGNRHEFVSIQSKLLAERYVKQFDLF